MNSRGRLSRRQFLAYTGTVTASALLAACAAPAPAAPGGEAAASGGAEAAPETTTLVAWFTDRRTINVMTEEEAIPDFQAANSDITVEMQFVPESELQQKLLTAKAAGNAPDLSSIDETFLDTLTKQEVLLPIPEDVIDVKAEMGELTAELYKISVNNAPPAYYGLPNGVFSACLFYNATLLEELGYTPDDIPTRWDDFMVWASEVTEWEGDTLKRSGFAIFGNEGSLAPDVRYHMGGPLDGNQFASKDQIRLGDELGVNAWKFAMDVYDVHKTDSKAEGLGSRERFGFGNAVTMYQWTWFNGVMDTTYTDIDWGLKNPPTMDGNPIYGRRGPDVGFTVTSQNTDNLAAAWKFWRYLVSPDYLSKYCKLRGVQPSLKAMWDDPNFSADAGPRWGAVAVNNRPENTVDEGFSPRELGDIVGRSLASIRDEEDDITSVLQANEVAANEFLANNPQWSIISAADYEANPQWLTSIG